MVRCYLRADPLGRANRRLPGVPRSARPAALPCPDNLRAVTDRPSLLVRTWNIAHGRDLRPNRDSGRYGHVRRKHVGEMAQLAARDRPDLVLLQEVPVW